MGILVPILHEETISEKCSDLWLETQVTSGKRESCILKPGLFPPWDSLELLGEVLRDEGEQWGGEQGK